MRRLAILMLISASALLQAQEISHRTAPTVIHKTDPAYTDEALAAGIQGTVILQLVIGADGIASDINVVRGLGYGLDEKAVACLQAWRFKPATLFGEPVEARASVEINFRLPPWEIATSPAERAASCRNRAASSARWHSAPDRTSTNRQNGFSPGRCKTIR